MHELQKKEISAPGEDKNLSLYYGADKIQKVIRVIHRGMINQQVSGSWNAMKASMIPFCPYAP